MTSDLVSNQSADHAFDATSGVERFYSTSLAAEIEFLTARARALGSVRANAALAPLQLKVRAYCVLSLACSGLNPSQRELAEFLNLDPSQVVTLIDQLEDRGSVIRETDARDRRSKVIVATSSGRRLFKKAEAAVKAAEDESLQALTSNERDLLRSLLTRVAF